MAVSSRQGRRSLSVDAFAALLEEGVAADQSSFALSVLSEDPAPDIGAKARRALRDVAHPPQNGWTSGLS